MEQVSSLLEQLSLDKTSPLIHDVEYMLWCFQHEVPELNPSKFRLRQKVCPEQLYKEILRILELKQQRHNLLELMPYIDEYLEHHMTF